MSVTTHQQSPAHKSSCTVQPCRDDAQLREYINSYWRKDHVLARDPRMFDFTYRTPWVDSDRFPNGTSVLCVYDDDGEHGQHGRLLGFLGSIMTPYPRKSSYWLALWHVLPELKGTGLGGALLRQMQQHAIDSNSWIGTFGAGPEAVPVYLKRGYMVRAVRRWIFDPQCDNPLASIESKNEAEVIPNEDWLRYRFDEHPIYSYQRDEHGVFRTESNEWGVVTHCCKLWDNSEDSVHQVYEEGLGIAETASKPFLLDSWSYNCPGRGWKLAPEDLVSVFHPPQARGNLIYASGYPFLPIAVTKGDCDQDRPN